MLPGAQVAGRRDRTEGLLLETDLVVVRDEIEDLSRSDEEAAIDPTAVGLRFFVELTYCASLAHAQLAEAPRRMHRGEREHLSVTAVKLDRRGHVDVSHAVAVGEEERLVGAEVALDALEAAAGHRLQPGLGERHRPVLFVMVIVEVHGRLASELERHVARHPLVIAEVFLDHLTAVTQAEHELLEAVLRVRFHHVPEDRPVADGHHRLRAKLGLFAQARALAAAEDYHFHRHSRHVTLVNRRSARTGGSHARSWEGRTKKLRRGIGNPISFIARMVKFPKL